MTSEEVKNMCRKMRIPFDENHPDHISTDKLSTLSPPFMEYILTDNPVYADGVRYIDIKDLSIRIYSDTEVSESEADVKRILEEEDIRWKRSSEFVEDIMMWAIVYKMEV